MHRCGGRRVTTNSPHSGCRPFGIARHVLSKIIALPAHLFLRHALPNLVPHLSRLWLRGNLPITPQVAEKYPPFQSENHDNGELVGGGVGDVVDDDGFGDAFGGLEFEAELFLEDGEERWVGGVGSFLGSPFDLEVEVAF